MFQDNGISFQDWQAILLSSLEVGGDYKQFLQVVNTCLKSLTKQRPLSPPLTEDRVPIFIEFTLPKIISQILGFGYIMNFEEGKLINQFLKRVVKSITEIRQFMSDDLIKSIPRIFNMYETLYQSNRNNDWFKNVCTCYNDQLDILTAILNSMISDNPKGFINFYILHISILTNLVKSKVNIQTLNFENNFIHDFKEFIETQFENPTFFSTNFDIISNAFDSLSKYLTASNSDESRGIQNLYHFLQQNISNPHVEIQKFIAHCLSTLCQNPKQARILLSEQKEKSDSIFDNLISSDILPETLNELQPFIQLQIEQGIINLKSLLKFWQACYESQFLNNNQVCVDLFAFSLKFLDSDSIRDFLSAIQINLSPFYYNVLGKTIFELQNLNRTIDIAIISIRILVSLAIVDECANQVLLNLIDLKLNNDILHALLDETIPLLKKVDQVDFACTVIKKAINISSDPSHLFDGDQSNIEEIMKMMDENNNNQIINLLFQYHLKIGSKPSSNLIKELLNNYSKDETWSFLRNLLKNKNYTNLEDFKELFQIAKLENPETATHSYYKFLKILIFKISNNYFIEVNGTMPVNNIHIPFKIKCNIIQGLDLMLRLYQFNNVDAKTVSSSKKFLLLLFKNWDTNISVNYLNEQIQNLILEVQTEPNEQNEPLIRSLQLVYDYIIELEINIDPEDFNAPRHFYPRNFLLLIIYINSIYTKKHYTIHFDLQKTLKNLKDRIAERENQSVSTLTFEDFQSNQEQLSLFECGITNNTSINIKINAYSSLSQNQQHYQSSPSYLFYNGQFGDVLLNLLDDNEKLNSIIWKILQLLPTAKSVSDIFNDQNQEESEIIQSFLNQLLKSENNYKKLYLIQSLSESNLNIFSHTDLLTILFGLFNDPLYREDIIYLFNSRYNDEYFPEAHELILELIYFIPQTNNDDLIGIIFQLINRIAGENDFKSLLESLGIFEKLNNSFWSNVINFVQIVNKHHDYGGDIFDFCQKRIVYNEGNFRFALYLLSDCIKYIDETQANFLFQNLIGRIQNYCELNENSSTKFQNSEDLRVFSNILDSVVSIINQFPSLIKQNDFPILSLFDIAFGQQYNLTQKSIFHIILECIKTQEINESKNLIISKLNEMINYNLDRWNYNPSIFARNAPYTGLRNLGATCFLNSIFQQMFHLFPVRYFLSTFEFNEGDELETLQRLFIQMAFTIRSFSDTSKFIETWHGWNKSLLNPKEQQDAVELFLALKDSFPTKIKDLFKGEMKNFLVGIGVPFDNSSTEEFYNLSISIKNHKNIESSFDEFIQEEQLSDYECDEMNKQKISVKKYLRISKLPSILVIQLTRFEYSLTSQDRYKINDRFEFPLLLNIKKLCEDQNDENENKYLYDLSGIVVHTGVATGGHYISNIRKGEDWWSFNDIEVTKISEKDVLNNAYGGKEGNSSAYVLFYTKNDYFSIEKSKNGEIEHRISFDNEFDYSNEVNGLNEIIKDNEIFEKSQALFGSYVIDFVQGFNEPLLNLSFYIKVLCHSRNYKKASQFISHLKEIIDSTNDDKIKTLENCTNFLNDHVNDIVDNYINCSQEALIINLSEIILFCFISLDKTINNDDDDKLLKPHPNSFVFFKNFAENVRKHANSYRQLPAMLCLIRKYITNYIFEAFKDGWVQILLSIVEAVYSSQISKNQNVLNNLNLSDLFVTLNSILSKVPKLNYDISSDLLKHAMDIKSSDSNKNSFTALLMTCVVNHNANVGKIKEIIPINTAQINKKLFENIKEIILDPRMEILKEKEESQKEKEKLQKEKESIQQNEPSISVTIKDNDSGEIIISPASSSIEIIGQQEFEGTKKEEFEGTKKEEFEGTKKEEFEETKKEEFEGTKKDEINEDNENHDSKTLEINFITKSIDDLIKKQFFTETEISMMLQNEIRNQNEELIKKIVEYSPRIFAEKLINKSNNTSRSYFTLYKVLIDKVQNGKNADQLMPSLLKSFDEYLESIIFDEKEIIKYIPTNPYQSTNNYTCDNFILTNYIELLKLLIVQQKDYTKERVELFIKMVKRIDSTKRIFTDYTIRGLMLILASFPRELFKDELYNIVIDYFLTRIDDAKIDQVSKEIEPIITILNKFLLIDTQMTKTLEIDINDEYFIEAVKIFNNKNLQTFCIQYLTNTMKNSTQHSIFSVSSNYSLNENSKKLFKIFLFIGEKLPEMKQICKEMAIEAMNRFAENKVTFETKIKLIIFYYDVLSELIDESMISYIFNEFIKIINKTGPAIQRNDMDLFRKFIEIISSLNLDIISDDINVDTNFFVNLSNYYQIGTRDLAKKILNWLYFHSTFVHDNIVDILTEMVSQKNMSQQGSYFDVAFQYSIQKKDADLLIKFFKIAKQKLDKNKAFQILTRIVNNKLGIDLFRFEINKTQENQNKQDENIKDENQSKEQENIKDENQSKEQENIKDENQSKEQENIKDENQERKEENIKDENQERKEENIKDENLNNNQEEESNKQQNDNEIEKDQDEIKNKEDENKNDENDQQINDNAENIVVVDKCQNEKEFDWIVPFLISNWDSFDKSYEEIQANSFFLKNMSDEARLKILKEAEDRYLFTNSIEVKNKISTVLLTYLQNCKDIVPQYRKITQFSKDMLQGKILQFQEKFYLMPFLKILFQS